MRIERHDVFHSARCFLQVFFYGLKLIFQISDNIGLFTSRCIIIVAVSGQDKSMKKITQSNFLYTHSPARNRKDSNNIFFFGRGTGCGKTAKVNKWGVRGFNNPWGVKCKHTIFCPQRRAYLQYISSSPGEQNGG